MAIACLGTWVRPDMCCCLCLCNTMCSAIVQPTFFLWKMICSVWTSRTPLFGCMTRSEHFHKPDVFAVFTMLHSDFIFDTPKKSIIYIKPLLLARNLFFLVEKKQPKIVGADFPLIQSINIANFHKIISMCSDKKDMW